MGLKNLKTKLKEISHTMNDSKEKCTSYLHRKKRKLMHNLKAVFFNKKKDIVNNNHSHKITITSKKEKYYNDKKYEMIILQKLDDADIDNMNTLSIYLLIDDLESILPHLNSKQKEKYLLLKERYQVLKEAEKKQKKKAEIFFPNIPTMPRQNNKENNLTKPDINNYANLDRFNINKKQDSTISFAKAISIVRDKKMHTRDEWEMAMQKLACTFGNKKRTSKETTAILNDFNKTEKMLAYYGHKIKTNNASAEEKLIYTALLYHLSTFEVIDNFSLNSLEDDINDYIADEALRYDNDLKSYQKTIK